MKGMPSMGDVVIVAYKPLPGQAAALEDLARAHVPFLRELGLATDRAPVLLRGKDGTIVEVFEWRQGGVEAAHSHTRIGELWAKYAEVCTYVKLSELPEAADMFATFEPLE
jgi:hypothetical protein